MPAIHIGTSGWNYDHWKGAFYPADRPKSGWLEYYAASFDTLEINATFYRTMSPATIRRWHDRTPAGFLWSIKAHRFITHIRRLRDVHEPITTFLHSLDPLGRKRGPVLLQLPPSLVFEAALLSDFLDCLPADVRVCLEARHASWLDSFDLLRRHGIAWCIAETAGRYPYAEAITADFVYIRLHGSQRLYSSAYSDDELQAWAERVRAWNCESFVYFNNDYMGFAPRNALRLKEILNA